MCKGVKNVNENLEIKKINNDSINIASNVVLN